MHINKYKKIIKLIEKNNLSSFELITNYGLFSGNTNLYKTLKIYDLVKSIENIKGDIIEFGTFRGNTGILIAKILNILKIKKKIYLFDSFKGLQNFQKIEGGVKKKFKNKYKGNKLILKEIIKFFDLKNVKIIENDAVQITNNFFKKYKFSLIILDMDLYEPTIKTLNITQNYLSKGGKYVFDEGNSNLWLGEKKALNEFLKKNKTHYRKKIISKFPYQPDVELKKIKKTP